MLAKIANKKKYSFWQKRLEKNFSNFVYNFQAQILWLFFFKMTYCSDWKFYKYKPMAMRPGLQVRAITGPSEEGREVVS